MALADAVVGARKVGQTITWTDADGTALDITGVTLTAVRKNLDTGLVTAITGTLDPAIDPTNGVFSWTYTALDVVEAGRFLVQFTATWPDTLKARSLSEDWFVHKEHVVA